MCITTGQAILESTIIGVWDIEHPQHGYQHVLCYQNSAQNRETSGNSMILAIPTYKELRAAQIINTENDVEFLREMAASVAPLEVFSRSHPAENAVIQMGVYHIAILNSLDDSSVQACLWEIPEEKRPEIAPELITFYKETYPGFPLLICCFNNEDAQEASPIMVHFDPAYPDTFMFNTVEAHGHVPELGEVVSFHQRIIASSYKIPEAFGDYQAFDHTGVSDHLLPFLPKYGQGQHVHDFIPNYDILLKNSTLAESDVIHVDLGILGEA